MIEYHTHEQPNRNVSEASALHVVAFTDISANNGHAHIVTLAGGELLRGYRSDGSSIEYDANKIALEKDIITKAHTHLWTNEDGAASSNGYSVRLLTPKTQLEIADYTSTKLPINHEFDLELHDFRSLLEQQEADEARRIDAIYLRSFGRFAFKHF